MNKHRVAILGFGVVGGGVADLILKNRAELSTYLGCEIEIAHILDLRDFPDSPLASLVTHDFGDILSDDSVDTVIEVMGGEHPAYEYSCAALVAGKNVITSNKEVVARHGDEFVRLAAEAGVSYRFIYRPTCRFRPSGYPLYKGKIENGRFPFSIWRYIINRVLRKTRYIINRVLRR